MTQPPQPSEPILGPATNLPLALLPVRLETRFVTESTGPKLLVRVYVDDLAVDSHEPGLTELERIWGKHFWNQAWRAGMGKPGERAAWDQLVHVLGGPRATYVAELLQPTNLNARPTDTVPDSSEPTTQPLFPSAPDRVSQAPRTSVMPDRWVALGYVGTQRVLLYTGRTITADPLVVGLSRTRGYDAVGLAQDPDAGWLVDFNAAELAGMGLRIPWTLPSGIILDRLLVLGTRAPASGHHGARLEALLRAQRYTEGLSFVPQGTPSNNMPDIVSGYSSLDTGFDGSPLGSRSPIRVGDGSNRDVTARALGISDTVFAGVRGTGDAEQCDAYYVNTALWKATWGYYLENILAGPGAPTEDAIRQAREHFSSYVRARGPLPAIRIGRQPYGLLPAMSLKLWQPREPTPIDAQMVRVIGALREFWLRSATIIPRLPDSIDRATSLLQVLAMSPTSIGFAVHPAQPVTRWPTTTGAMPPTGRLDELRRLQNQLGLTLTPRHARSVFTSNQQAQPVVSGLVQPPVAVPGWPLPQEVLSESDPVTPNYVAWLATAPLNDIRNEGFTPVPSTLLYTILRHAALLEYVAAAYRIRNTPADARGEPDIVGSQTPTPWDVLTQTVTGADPPGISTYLDAIKANLIAEENRDVAPSGAIWRRSLYDVGSITNATRSGQLREFAACMRSISSLGRTGSAKVGRLAAETLDLSSHRLDAWATSFATKRLEALRAQSGSGIFLGGYGFVEGLKATPRSEVTQRPVIPAGESAPELASPLLTSPNNKGFLHTPSLAHATTAAILRSGYLSRKETLNRDGQALAVNLSSARVRDAQWLLDGVRQGQPLSTLLGYRFERGLHENHTGGLLDRYIPAFRALAPRDVPPPGALTTIVDGMALLSKHRAGAILWGSNGLPAAGTPDAIACIDEVTALDTTLDAIADLVTAEAVHHVALGNPMRAGATLEAVAHGEAPPPEMEVTRTSRTGVGISHRLLAFFQDGPAPAGWTATPRAAAEPFLNAWAARLFGPGAANAVCRIEYFDTTTGARITTSNGQALPTSVQLADPNLRLAPLDVVYLPERGAAAQWSEIEQRVAYVALRASNVPANAEVRLTFARDATASPQTLSFAEVLEAARAARQLFTSARPMRAGDLALANAQLASDLAADAPPSPASDPDVLVRLAPRAAAASTAFKTAVNRLQAAVQSIPPGPDLDQLRTLLLDLSAFGISGAVPLFATGAANTIRVRLLAQANSVASESADRKNRLETLEKGASGASSTPEAERDYHLERLRIIFGDEFRVLPRLHAPDAPSLSATFAASDTLQAGNPLESVTWFQRATRVRTHAAMLDTSLMYAEALGGADSLTLRVGQLPVSSPDRWVGLPVPPQPPELVGTPPPRPPGGRLSLVVHFIGAVDLSKPVAGLMVDEWTEVVPSAEETTGLVFHYDQPNSRAPQAILLAVPPDGRATWNLAALEATVLETIEWSRLRTVDTSALGELTHYLPALMFASASPTTTVAINAARLTPSG